MSGPDGFKPGDNGPGGGFPGMGIPGAARVFQVMQSRPSKAKRVAISVFLLLLALPLLILALAAGIISLGVYLILSGWTRLFASRTPDWAEHDTEGRKGVRVKR